MASEPKTDINPRSGPDRLAIRMTPAIRDFLLIVTALAVITLAHFFTPLSYFTLHNLYRNLYFVPIIYGSMRFSLVGGISTALAATILYSPHVLLYFGTLPVEATNDLQQIALFNVIGILSGFLVEAEKKQRERYRKTAAELAESLKTLQWHTDAVEGMRAYIENVLDSLSCGVITLDLQRRVTTCNPAAQAFLGPETTGKHFDEVARPIFAIDPATLLAESGDHQVQTEVALGRKVPVSVISAPLKTKEGNVIGSVIIIEDLSEIRSLERQVQHADRLTALGSLAGSLAHEIRNPLGIIRASAQILDFELTTPDLKECTGVIRQEIDRIERLVQQLLTFARPHDPNFVNFDPVAWLRDLEPMLKAYAAQQAVKLDLSLSEPLMPIIGDKEMLEQCIINLVLNSTQAMPQGGNIQISAVMTEEDKRGNLPSSRIRLSITDNGPGIEPSELDRIFEPFFSTKTDGTGLGLAIVKQIVETHSGQVEVESKVGKGSTFTLVLPTVER